jgi:dihydrofolate synthase/folylpolyglutamate synthase
VNLPRTPAEAVAFLAAGSPSTVRLGLERVEAALSALGHPERRVPALHLAGTNGKGSASAFCDAALRAQGHKVGLYTSPHLVRINERIRVDGEELSDTALGEAVLAVLTAHPPAATELTYFELGTVAAFWHFARVGADVAVVETGLGGRLDATSTCAPRVCALTSISLDHQELLGGTLGAIATEKAGIFKPGVPAVTCAQAPEALEAIVRRAGALAIPLGVEERDYRALLTESGFSYQGPRWSLKDVTLGLRGAHQRQNAGVAVAALEALDAQGVTVTPQAVARGLTEARWPGRLEELPGSPPVLLDGAHNEAGAQALAQALPALYPGRRVHLVFGVLADKAYPQMLEAL